MADYQLELRQVVDYPRCRIYREFMQTLIADRSIRTGGCSGLFYYVVLCSYANFRTSYRRIDGISYTVYPGEWICSITDITEWFRVRFHYQAFTILKSLQDRQLITFTRLGRGHIVKFSITDWQRNNTALDYNCPCQKIPVFLHSCFNGNGVDLRGTRIRDGCHSGSLDLCDL